MHNSKNDISVYFALYEPYENFATSLEHLGQISFNQMKKILSALASQTPTDNACIQGLEAQYTDGASYGHLAGSMGHRRQLELSCMQWKNNTAPMPCIKKVAKDAPDDIRMRICARRLAAGKCRDEFIRRTLGAALFPQFYKNEKQR